MIGKIRLTGATVFTAGVMLEIADLFDVLSTAYLHFLLMAAGVLLLATTALITGKETSMLCRIGLHKYDRVGWDDELRSAAIYQCERCGNKKRVVKTA
ncbi:hypothetical protein CR205_12060 [Alteribacter lacisalsi]|uniref:Uncharacterized protein n=1 Tax=Alteribacter lacisalsi TaxID=2045244 RepID=A0A2W0HI16_9BACI|nr:hypothetical protein [Alteribacter lacisalsi]PYZ96449.1 hypothetical protein CR205_12060 [Alteribacter lacisalsi]